MGTKVTVAALPACDLAGKAGHPPREATVDGKTTFGPWANMCGDCHLTYGVGLGTGRGQRLTTPIHAAVELAKREILGDVEAMYFAPEDISSFADLHDYVDANEYGGLTMTDLDGEDLIRFADAVQGAVDAWIKGGGLR